MTLALARRPRLLVLDEPMAMLDPLARHDFMATVMTAIADDGVSVVLSSHVLAELERVADYLVLFRGAASRWRARSRTCSPATACSPAQLSKPRGIRERWSVVHDQPWREPRRICSSGATAPPTRCHQAGRRTRSAWKSSTLAYLREPGAAALPGPARGRDAEQSEVAT